MKVLSLVCGFVCATCFIYAHQSQAGSLSINGVRQSGFVVRAFHVNENGDVNIEGGAGGAHGGVTPEGPIDNGSYPAVPNLVNVPYLDFFNPKRNSAFDNAPWYGQTQSRPTPRLINGFVYAFPLDPLQQELSGTISVAPDSSGGGVSRDFWISVYPGGPSVDQLRCSRLSALTTTIRWRVSSNGSVSDSRCPLKTNKRYFFNTKNNSQSCRSEQGCSYLWANSPTPHLR